jgi:hypothetical protein
LEVLHVVRPVRTYLQVGNTQLDINTFFWAWDACFCQAVEFPEKRIDIDKTFRHISLNTPWPTPTRHLSIKGIAHNTHHVCSILPFNVRISYPKRQPRMPQAPLEMSCLFHMYFRQKRCSVGQPKRNFIAASRNRFMAHPDPVCHLFSPHCPGSPQNTQSSGSYSNCHLSMH